VLKRVDVKIDVDGDTSFEGGGWWRTNRVTGRELGELKAEGHPTYRAFRLSKGGSKLHMSRAPETFFTNRCYRI
jgi:hypothetical protein